MPRVPERDGLAAVPGGLVLTAGGIWPKHERLPDSPSFAAGLGNGRDFKSAPFRIIAKPLDSAFSVSCLQRVDF